ncbi:hypothetical protein T02_16107 [Trichinella nativa]|uniref:Uncharacterized protein n=1 Tax=Trichinella nativa TaxID=6335 RepID=A0A0V1KWD3_9BILA|nr:hypothetical protein T02_16107 [Trichinella nativa]
MQSSSNLILSPALVLALFSVCIGIAATVTNYWSYEVWILYFKVYRLNNGLWKRCNLRYPVHPPGTYIEKCIDRFVEGRLKNLEFRQVITWDHLTHNATWEVTLKLAMLIAEHHDQNSAGHFGWPLYRLHFKEELLQRIVLSKADGGDLVPHLKSMNVKDAAT